MKKMIKIIVTLLASVIVLLISINIYNKMKVKNIFDEIYYDSKNASGELFNKRSLLGNIKGMSSNAMVLTGVAAPEGELVIMEAYDSESLNYPMKTLSITNNSTKKKLGIAYSYTVTQNITIFFENEYTVKTRNLTKSISFVELDSGKRITTKNEIIDTLKNYNITDKQLLEWDNKGMDKVLKDWTTVYSSEYSSKKLGDVSVKTEW